MQFQFHLIAILFLRLGTEKLQVPITALGNRWMALEGLDSHCNEPFNYRSDNEAAKLT